MDRIRFSTLKNMADSAAHYKHALDNPIVPSRPMRIGKAVHSLLLGGDLVVSSGTDTRRGKQFQEDAPGTLLLSLPEFEQASDIAASVRANNLAMDYLAGQHEVEIDFEANGVDCRCHVDVLHDARVVELKITASTEPSELSRHAQRSYWHAQLAWYRRAAGDPMRSLYIVAVEPTPPYVCTVLRVPESIAAAGDKSCNEWLDKLIECEKSGVYPGYTDGVFEMEAMRK